jgi:hypothetical protein
LLYAILLLHLFGFSSLIQAGDDPMHYRRVLRRPVVGKHVYQAWPYVETDRVYLGTVTNRRGRPIYQVMTEDRSVQAAIVKHGHTSLIFFDMKDRVKAEYDLSEDPPILLRHNRLLFESTIDSLGENGEHHRLHRRHWERVTLPFPKYIRGAHGFNDLISP